MIGGGLHLLLAIYLFFAMTEAGYKAIPRKSMGNVARVGAGVKSSLTSIRRRPLILTILAITVVWGLSGEGVDRLYQVHLLKWRGRVWGVDPCGPGMQRRSVGSCAPAVCAGIGQATGRLARRLEPVSDVD